ncbi:MAG: hypothetical protein U0904_02845 [Candidatus Nanopelagicales bacterium]|nr:hypothetical protein [Candidatus Nanopelagicales bacterium]
MTRPDPPEREPEAWVRELLAAQPRPRIPADVLARIEATTAEEARARAAAGAGRDQPRWRRYPLAKLAAAASAAAAIVVLGLILAPQLTSSPSTVAAEACPVIVEDADLIAISHQTGSDFAAANLPQLAAGLMASQPGCESGQPVSATTDQFMKSEGDMAARASSIGPTELDHPFFDQRRCVESAAQGLPVMTVDRGYFGSVPVTLVVVSVSMGDARILIADCQAEGESRILQETSWQY